ncbi:hypothetical protein ABIE56_003048 [Luteibacter sp. 621]|uniref:hypothetical protein n=1 Tax=Luteibacter sp. 621 TaxID=3373916 RepID=UPI003D1D51DB
MTMRLRFRRVLVTACAAVLVVPLASHASDADPWDGAWHTSLSVYGWLPGISATMRYRLPNGTIFTNRSDSGLLSKLSGAFMMDVTVRKGRWGVYADLDWVKFSDEDGRVAQVGGRWIGADAHLDTRWNAKGGLATLAGVYTLGHSSQGYVDLLLGARYLWLKGNVGWNFGIEGTGGRFGIEDSGHLNRQTHVTDGIIGVRGRWTPFPSHAVFIPYYFDIGTGSSDRTQQYVAGIGYAFHWGDIALNYRDVEYHEHGSDAFLRDVRLSGPSLTLSWTF